MPRTKNITQLKLRSEPILSERLAVAPTIRFRHRICHGLRHRLTQCFRECHAEQCGERFGESFRLGHTRSLILNFRVADA
jgi:hypothetical protein